ncbi:metallophosphoesterase [Cupriavidus sp. DF5525]|uniref:metallophosphoesterase n=1 Tax=Cupriavidus sp. DF5525 TaxID=3160989 RepID=UPI0032E0310D
MSAGHVFICGDPHGEFGPLIESVHRHCPEAVVLAGDIQARRPLDEELASILPLTQVWWIPGNHDTDSDADYDNLFGSGLADRNLDWEGGHDRRPSDCRARGDFSRPGLDAARTIARRARH